MLVARRVSPYLLLTLTPFFWSCNWIVGRGLASEIPPMAMAFFRWFFAIAILMPFAWPHFVRDWPRIRTHWKILVLLGAVGVCAHNVLVYVGLHLHVMSFLLAVAIAGGLCILPLWLGEMALGKFVYWSWANLAALLFIALFSAVLAYLFWNRGVAEVGASVAGLFVHLMPVFGVLLAWLFLGEALAPYHVAGIGLIMAGIWLTSRYGRSRRDVDRAAAVGTD